jgi:hypothetical protein
MESINKRGAWNKGKLVGHKPPLKPKDIWAIRIYLQNAHAVPRPRHVQSGHRQQATGLRSCQPAGSRRHAWESGSPPCHGYSEEDAAAGAVRANGAYKGGGVSAWAGKNPHLRGDQFPVPKQSGEVAPRFDTPICAYRASLGRICWPWTHPAYGDAFHAENQGNADLQAHEEPAGCPVC